MQWNEILRDVLNGKLKIVQNKKTESNSESEDGEVEDEESDFENHDTSEREGCYRPITTNITRGRPKPSHLRRTKYG